MPKELRVARRAVDPNAAAPRRMKADVEPAPEPPAPPQTANLLVTIDESHRAVAEARVRNVLLRAGFPGGRLTAPPGPGLVAAQVASEDSREAVPRLRSMLLESPELFRHTHRWVPISTWTKAEPRGLQRLSERANIEIGRDAAWAIQLERRSTTLSREAAVAGVSRSIENPNISLDTPTKILHLEIVGEDAGMAVLDPDQQLRVDQNLQDAGSRIGRP